MTVELIHPYDLYDLLSSRNTPLPRAVGVGIEPVKCAAEVNSALVYDCKRDLLEINGRIYMETTSVPYRSKSFDEKTEQLSTALSSPNRANPYKVL